MIKQVKPKKRNPKYDPQEAVIPERYEISEEELANPEESEESIDIQLQEMSEGDPVQAGDNSQKEDSGGLLSNLPDDVRAYIERKASYAQPSSIQEKFEDLNQAIDDYLSNPFELPSPAEMLEEVSGEIQEEKEDLKNFIKNAVKEAVEKAEEAMSGNNDTMEEEERGKEEPETPSQTPENAPNQQEDVGNVTLLERKFLDALYRLQIGGSMLGLIPTGEYIEEGSNMMNFDLIPRMNKILPSDKIRLSEFEEMNDVYSLTEKSLTELIIVMRELFKEKGIIDKKQ